MASNDKRRAKFRRVKESDVPAFNDFRCHKGYGEIWALRGQAYSSQAWCIKVSVMIMEAMKSIEYG